MLTFLLLLLLSPLTVMGDWTDWFSSDYSDNSMQDQQDSGINLWDVAMKLGQMAITNDEDNNSNGNSNQLLSNILNSASGLISG